MSCVVIEFTKLPEEFDWNYYHQLFSQFGIIKKLFISPDGTFGKVYFSSLEEATAVYREISNDPSINLVLLEPVVGDYPNRKSNRTSSDMNHSYHKGYFYDDFEVRTSKFQYVDVFGRLVSTVQAEDGDIYVSLNELKKSGFELYEAGSLPKPGEITCLNEQQLHEFEMYLKMKAKKFMVSHKRYISEDKINTIINKEIKPYKPPERSVKMDSSGLLKISASPISNLNEFSSNRNRMSFDSNVVSRSKNNSFSQKSRHSMSGSRFSNTDADRSNDQSKQKNDYFAVRDLSSPSSVRSSDYNHDHSNGWSIDKSNKKSGSSLSKAPTLYSDQKCNNWNKKSNNEETLRKPFDRGNNNDKECETKTSLYNNRNVHGSNLTDNYSNKPSTDASLNSNSFQKEEDGTCHAQVRKLPMEPKNKIERVVTPNLIDSNKHEPAHVKEPTATLISEPKSDSTSAKKNVSFEEPAVDISNCQISEPAVGSNASTLNKIEEQKNILPTCLRRSVVEIGTSDSGIFECTEILSLNTFVAFVLLNDFSEQLCELESITAETKPDPGFKPNVGDLVAVINNSEYVRGIILNKSDLKYICALIDFGTIVSVDETRQLPDKFKDIPEFTCFCKVDDVKVLEDIKSNGDGNISVTITAPGKLTVKIESIGKEHEIIAIKWNPLETSSLTAKRVINNPSPVVKIHPESPIAAEETASMVYKLPSVANKLKNGDIVIIAAENEGSLLVRTKECNILLKQINQELINYDGKPHMKTLEIGQLAIASFNYNGLYRVIIKSIKNNIATVEYIDYGNTDDVPTKMILTINDKLAKISNTLIKINLRGFGSTKFSDKALHILEECSAKKEKFTVVDIAGQENEYDLLFADQSSLTEKLQQLHNALPVPPKLELVTKSSPPPVNLSVCEKPTVDTCTKLNDLPPSKFKIGVNEVMCMYTGDMKEGNVSFCLATSETSDLLSEIQDKINNYISEPVLPYKPQIDEVCLAKFLDTWYRACVIDNDESGYSVYYIDYGNSHAVPPSDICKIPQDLTKIEPLASQCILKDIMAENADVIHDSLILKMQTDLQENELYNINVIENVEGYLIITIPTLYEKWKKEGLL